jgi:hypothetical protein
MEKSNEIFEKLRTAKGHFLGQATEEEMTHLGDHLGFNGLAFGGFFDSAATQLIEDFKAISEDQVIFQGPILYNPNIRGAPFFLQPSFHSGMEHKKWNFRMTTDLSKSAFWLCLNNSAAHVSL